MLGLGRSKTYELIATGALPTVRVGRCVRVPMHAVRRWVEAQYERDATESPPADN